MSLLNLMANVPYTRWFHLAEIWAWCTQCTCFTSQYLRYAPQLVYDTSDTQCSGLYSVLEFLARGEGGWVGVMPTVFCWATVLTMTPMPQLNDQEGERESVCVIWGGREGRAKGAGPAWAGGGVLAWPWLSRQRWQDQQWWWKWWWLHAQAGMRGVVRRCMFVAPDLPVVCTCESLVPLLLLLGLASSQRGDCQHITCACCKHSMPSPCQGSPASNNAVRPGHQPCCDSL